MWGNDKWSRKGRMRLGGEGPFLLCVKEFGPLHRLQEPLRRHQLRMTSNFALESPVWPLMWNAHYSRMQLGDYYHHPGKK